MFVTQKFIRTPTSLEICVRGCPNKHPWTFRTNTTGISSLLQHIYIKRWRVAFVIRDELLIGVCVLYVSRTRELMRKTWGLLSKVYSLSNYLEFWKIGILEINWNCLTNEFGNDQPHFLNSFVKAFTTNKNLKEKKLEKDIDGGSSVTRRLTAKPMELKSIFCSICTKTDQPNKIKWCIFLSRVDNNPRRDN